MILIGKKETFILKMVLMSIKKRQIIILIGNKRNIYPTNGMHLIIPERKI